MSLPTSETACSHEAIPQHIINGVMDKAVQDWLRVHQELMNKEAAFTELALRVASGEASIESLDEERRALMGLRAHCTVLYETAFPRSAKRGA